MAYPPAPAPMQQPAPIKQGNGFGVTALVLGIIGLVLGLIPVVNVFTGIPLGVLAIIFGIIALAKAGSRGGKGKGTGGTGLVLGILAIGAAIVINYVFVQAADEYIDEEWKQACEDAGLTEEECGDYEDWESQLENLETP
ncbi:hypothetical protein [Glycomyces tritici]|uniref:DUF4190 domain-containing protein n=1 Tax=Glycomyces tritici TaxID=2665176 RepID=A0ABT7YNT7_9ACTN|nr:hypothetical protein [Glycomyces tritici]MDN3240310.1 hypothetical protein [Glycomyces tritici]